VHGDSFRLLQPKVVIVVGGVDGDGYQTGNVEIVDVYKDDYRSRRSFNCPKPPDYPVSIEGHVGGVVDGKVVVCGGFTKDPDAAAAKSSGYRSDCFKLDLFDNEWKPEVGMSSKRYLATAVSVPSYGRYSGMG